MEQDFEDMIKEQVKNVISVRIDIEIERQVEKFRKKLEDRKDDYIAEVLKGIRIYHERDMHYERMNYKITFENIYRLEEGGNKL